MKNRRERRLARSAGVIAVLLACVFLVTIVWVVGGDRKDAFLTVLCFIALELWGRHLILIQKVEDIEEAVHILAFPKFRVTEHDGKWELAEVVMPPSEVDSQERH